MTSGGCSLSSGSSRTLSFAPGGSGSVLSQAEAGAASNAASRHGTHSQINRDIQDMIDLRWSASDQSSSAFLSNFSGVVYRKMSCSSPSLLLTLNGEPLSATSPLT